MPGLDDILGKHHTEPRLGLSVDEILAVLRAVEACESVGVKRVLNCSVTSGGRVVVQTGDWSGPLAGGGSYALAEKTDDGWRIVDVRQWC